MSTKILLIGAGGLATKTFLLWQESDQLNKILECTDVALLDTHANQFERIEERIIKFSANSHGAGGNFDAGVEKFQNIKEEARELIGKHDLIILLAGLGGGTGAGFAHELIKLIKESNKQPYFIGNTLKFYEKNKVAPKMNYDFVKLMLDSREEGAPYTLFNSKQIEHIIYNQPYGMFESILANQISSFIQGLSFTLKYSMIDLADFQDKVFRSGACHFAMSQNSDIDKALEEIMSDEIYAHDIDYLSSYTLLYSRLEGKEIKKVIREVEAATDTDSNKIDELKLEQKTLMFFGTCSELQTVEQTVTNTLRTPNIYLQTVEFNGKSQNSKKVTNSEEVFANTLTDTLRTPEQTVTDSSRTVGRQELLSLIWNDKKLGEMSLGEAESFVNSNLSNLEKELSVKFQEQTFMTRSAIDTYKKKLK